jgi:hypothetical protein
MAIPGLFYVSRSVRPGDCLRPAGSGGGSSKEGPLGTTRRRLILRRTSISARQSSKILTRSSSAAMRSASAPVGFPTLAVLEEVHAVAAGRRDRLACLAVSGPRILTDRRHAYRCVHRALHDVPAALVGIADGATPDHLERWVLGVDGVATDLASRVVAAVRWRLGHAPSVLRGRSSVGRAPGWQPGGRGFDSRRLHKWGRLHASACTGSMMS